MRIERRPYGSPHIQILDPVALRRRRIEAGLHPTALTDAVSATNSQTIHRLERGCDQSHLTFGFLATVCETLGVDVSDLLDRSHRATDSCDKTESSGEADDAARVGALLAAAGEWCPVDHLADTLRWNLERTVCALDRLDVRLAAAGQRLARRADHAVCIRAVPDDTELAHLGQRNIDHQGVSRSNAQLLHALSRHPCSIRDITGGRTPRRSHVRAET